MQPTVAWKARAHRLSPTRLVWPTISTRRSTSLVPRGLARGASQRTTPLSRVEAHQALQARHQGVAHGHQHASLAQYQGLARALLAPQAVAVAAS